MNHRNTIILKVKLKEVTTLQTISLKTFHDTYYEKNDPKNFDSFIANAFALDKLKDELRHADSEFYFVKNQNQVIGYLKLNHGNAQTENILPHALEIERIYVLKEFQGMGIGKDLIAHAVKRTRDMGLKNLWLGVWEKNPKAIQFYERMGFVHFGTHIFTVGTEDQTDIVMRYEC